MSSNNDKCYQCQETSHVACYCPHSDCDKYGHVAADCPDKIPLSDTPACHRSNITSRHDRSSSRHHSHPDVPTMITRIGTGSVVPNPTHITMDIGVAAIMTPARAAPDHSTDPHIITTHATEAQVHTATAMTHHTADPHPIETFLEMTVDLDHTNLTDNTTNQHEDLTQVCKQCLEGQKTQTGYNDDPPSEYYSSDDQDSDSEDDLN